MAQATEGKGPARVASPGRQRGQDGFAPGAAAPHRPGPPAGRRPRPAGRCFTHKSTCWRRVASSSAWGKASGTPAAASFSWRLSRRKTPTASSSESLPEATPWAACCLGPARLARQAPARLGQAPEDGAGQPEGERHPGQAHQAGQQQAGEHRRPVARGWSRWQRVRLGNEYPNGHEKVVRAG